MSIQDIDATLPRNSLQSIIGLHDMGDTEEVDSETKNITEH